MAEKSSDQVISQNGFVGFTVQAFSHRNYTDGEIVVYEEVVTNYGGHYDPSAGIFTCPVTGYYLFSLSTMNPGGQTTATRLLVGSYELLYTWARDDSQEHSTTVGISLCEAGQSVYTICRRQQCPVWGNNMSSMTGTLLRINQ